MPMKQSLSNSLLSLTRKERESLSSSSVSKASSDSEVTEIDFNNVPNDINPNSENSITSDANEEVTNNQQSTLLGSTLRNITRKGRDTFRESFSITAGFSNFSNHGNKELISDSQINTNQSKTSPTNDFVKEEKESMKLLTILKSNLIQMPSTPNSNNINDIEIKVSKQYEEILNSLGFFSDEQELERITLIGQFNILLKDSSGQKLDGNYITIEKFVIDVINKRIEPDWADAAFRAFSKNGKMSKNEYFLAFKALQVTEQNMNNPVWIQLRRHLIFIYYDRETQRKWNRDNFVDFMKDFSASKERPEAFGLVNKMIVNLPDSVLSGQERAEDNSNFIQDYAKLKLDLAQKELDYQQLTLAYLKLEKQFVALKLDMAQLIDSIDTCDDDMMTTMSCHGKV